MTRPNYDAPTKHPGESMRSLSAYLSGLSRRDVGFAIASLVVTAIIVTGFLVESRWGYMRPDPTIVYFENWSEGRSRAQARSRQQRELAERERLLAEAKAAEAKAAEAKEAQARAAEAKAAPAGAASGPKAPGAPAS